MSANDITAEIEELFREHGDKRYSAETRRLLGVLNERLRDREYLMDDYSIVDMAHVPWVDCLVSFYKAREHLGYDEFEHVEKWRTRVMARPAYQRGKEVCRLHKD